MAGVIHLLAIKKYLFLPTHLIRMLNLTEYFSYHPECQLENMIARHFSKIFLNISNAQKKQRFYNGGYSNTDFRSY